MQSDPKALDPMLTFKGTKVAPRGPLARIYFGAGHLKVWHTQSGFKASYQLDFEQGAIELETVLDNGRWAFSPRRGTEDADACRRYAEAFARMGQKTLQRLAQRQAA